MSNRILASFLLTLAACSSPDEPSGQLAKPLIVGKPWEVVSMQGQPLVEFTSISLSLGFDHDLSGSAGLNRYQGTYDLDGARFAAHVQVMTRSDLDRPKGVLAQEKRYLELLQSADGILLESAQELTLTRGGRKILRFRQQRLW